MSQFNDNNYYGGTAGGGYMTTGSPYGSVAGSPGGFARKSETAHSLRPMTIYQLIQASQAHTDADWVLDDQEIGQVTVVAHIASVQTQATNSQYMLDDGSGRIEARHWTDSSMEDESEKNGIAEGAYVRVLGSLKTFGNKKYINTNLIRPIDSPAEIYFHLLEAMTVTMVWERGPPPRPGQNLQEVTPQQNGAGSSTAYSAQPAVSSSDQYSHLPKLHHAIIAFMQAQPSNAEGIHVSAIARAVGGNAVTISDALDKLTDDGVVYSTADESHFLLLNDYITLVNLSSCPHLVTVLDYIRLMMSDQQFHDEPIVMVPWVPPKSDTWKDILRPVTIFQLLQAESSPFFEDKSVVIEGRGFAAVTFIAHAVTVTINAASICCTLEDGTGRIQAYKDFNSLSQGHGLSVEAEKEEIDQYKALEQTYVEVLGTPRKDLNKTKLQINYIHPVHGYHHVLHHTLNVIHSHILTHQHIQPYDFQVDRDIRSNDDMEIYIPVDDDQAYQDDLSIQHHITDVIPASSRHAVLPNTFTPQRHWPYATLKPLERAIMHYMSHHRNHQVSVVELAQAIPGSCGCTELQFNVAVQELLSEAYITSPLDDGYVVITPRH